MKAICKQYCFFGGIAEVGDIVEANKPSQYVIKLTGPLPKCNIETRGIDHSLVCGHNLEFPKCKPETACNDFEMLYRGSDNLNPTFWSVTVTEGSKAVLKVLSLDVAQKLYDELPSKLSDRNYLFSPEAYKLSAEYLNQANASLKKAERERLGDVKPSRQGPSESQDPHELLG